MFRLLFSSRGRIGRGSYWVGMICLTIIATLVVLLANLAKGSPAPDAADGTTTPSLLMLVAAVIVIVIETVSAVCLGVKRYHDRDKSGWWVLIQLIPVIGPIWAIVELGFLPGAAGSNRYGAGTGMGASEASAA